MHDHDHDDEHGGCGCGHDHHDHSAADISSQPTLDVASQSLSNALRLSFLVLTVVMVFAVCAFLVSGVSCVGADKVAVIKVFGKVVGQSEKRGGLVYTWPYPIGDVQIVAVNQRELTVTDFWWYQTPADVTGTARDRAVATGGMLRPGMDGALFTGDQNLLHAKITCMYRIENPQAYLQRVAGNDVRQTPESDPDLDPMVRAAICDAAIRLAAVQTADNIFKARGEFINQLQQSTQEDIDRLLPVGPNDTRVVTIASVSASFNWPAGAQDASEMAQVASQNYRGRIEQAKSEAGRKLVEAAGPKYTELVGTPWEPQRPEVGADMNLIGQYSEVREELSRARQAQTDAHDRGDAAAATVQAKLVKQYHAQAETLLAKIDKLLVSNTIQGRVAQIMSSARQDQQNYFADVQARENSFRSDLEVFKSTPELLLENRWAETRDQILQSQLVEKMYLVFGSGKTTFYINRDPNITKLINRAQLAADKEKEQSQGQDKGPRP
jgi:regulator of protease activity HflC (stomatin/prohibitin superfamily)